jgi:lactoylglutathione lyase
MISFGYCIVYVEDVCKSLDFFEKSFGLQRRFLHPSESYGELETGQTVLAFARFSMANDHFPDGYVRANGAKPVGMEIALVTTDVHGAHATALGLGALEISAPQQKPWGQLVSYIRAPDGVLIELCSPMT